MNSKQKKSFFLFSDFRSVLNFQPETFAFETSWAKPASLVTLFKSQLYLFIFVSLNFFHISDNFRITLGITVVKTWATLRRLKLNHLQSRRRSRDEQNVTNAKVNARYCKNLWNILEILCNSTFFMRQAGALRLAKVNPNNPFGSGPMKQWFHVDCFFGLKKTKTSKTIKSSADVEGWDLLSTEEKDDLIDKIGPDFKIESSPSKPSHKSPSSSADSKDNLFSEFQKIVNKIANEPSYNNKSQILQRFLRDVRSQMLKLVLS